MGPDPMTGVLERDHMIISDTEARGGKKATREWRRRYSDESISQSWPEPAAAGRGKEGLFPGAFKGSGKGGQLAPRLLTSVSESVRKYMSVVLNRSDCGNFLRRHGNQ